MENIKKAFEDLCKNADKNKSLHVDIKELVNKLSYKELVYVEEKQLVKRKFEQLFELFIGVLKDNSLYKSEYILSVIDGLLNAINAKKEAILYEKIRQRDKLNKQILEQTKQMKNNVDLIYHCIENSFCEDKEVQNALKDAKLNGVYELGILKEVFEEALLTSIEKGTDIEDTIANIAKDFVFRAINTGEFTKERFLNIVKTVLEVSVDVADSDLLHAKEILRGSIFGSYDGISKSIEIFRNNIQFAPDDGESICEEYLKELKKELHLIDERFIDLLKQMAHQSQSKSSQIIDEILKKELDNVFMRVKRLSNETKDVINEKLELVKENANSKLELVKEKSEELEKKASEKFEEIKSNKNAIEAQKLGKRAWERAKEFIKNAKDMIDKK